MENHSSEPTANTLSSTVVGGTQSHQKFNWEMATKRALQHQLTRAIHLARTNSDYRIAHPSECRANPENEIQQHCHPEAKLRIIKIHLKTLEHSQVPAVIRPKRMNRNG